MLAQVADRKAGNQTEADYGIPKGLALRDEIARYFRIAAALFKDFSASSNPSAESTVAFIQTLVREVFGFSNIEQQNDSEGVALSAKRGRVPIVVVSPADTG